MLKFTKVIQKSVKCLMHLLFFMAVKYSEHSATVWTWTYYALNPLTTSITRWLLHIRLFSCSLCENSPFFKKQRKKLSYCMMWPHAVPLGQFLVPHPSHLLLNIIFSVCSNWQFRFLTAAVFYCLSFQGAIMSIHSRAQRFEVLPNGTLIIQNVQLQDRGTYICSAHSSLGRDRWDYWH